ncbi:transposase [Pedobacter helvus]|uniref:Transposase n=1 Tax=Pedobacter helvus TaxID=2563444 RepID=A0ABW9JQP7_9SPHI|nr:transposase [Pedobacter ureilyticus]
MCCCLCFHSYISTRLSLISFYYTRFLAKRRSSRVEPVLGTLLNYHNMKRVSTRGIANANKHVLMADLTYNLKKYLKFISKKVQLNAQMLDLPREGRKQD